MPTLQEIEGALQNAHAAGDFVAAQRLADLYRETAQAAPAAAEPAPEQRSFGDDVLRQVGLTARAGAEGAASLGGIVYDPIAALLNLGISDESQIPGLQYQVNQLLNQAGVAQPESTAERIVQAATQGLVGGGGTVGLARGAAKLATSPTALNAIQTIGAGALGQVTGGGAAGAASQATAEAGGGGVAQFAAGLVGGIAGGGRAPPQIEAPGIPTSDQIRRTAQGFADRGPDPDAALARPPPVSDERAVELGNVIKRAVEPGKGATQAKEELAVIARTNPEAAAAAERLKIDLPPDFLSDDIALQQTAGLVRSKAGSQASADYVQTIRSSIERANEIMRDIDASPDVSSISERVFQNLDGSIKKLGEQEKQMHGAVNNAFPDSTPATTPNARKALLDIVEDLGGKAGLSGPEKKLFAAIVDAKTPITYGRLERERQALGNAIFKNEGVYKDGSKNDLKRIYGALAEDKKATVSASGSPVLTEVLKVANDLTQKRKGIEDRVVDAFGSDTRGSIGSILRSSLVSGSKGDVKSLNKVIDTVPKELRREAILSGISSASLSNRALEGGFGFAEFSKLFRGLKSNRVIYNKIASEVGAPTMKVLEDLNTISQRITTARANFITTGKALQPVLDTLGAEKLVDRVMSTSTGKTSVNAVVTGIGAATAGPVGAMAASGLTDFLTRGKSEPVKAAAALFNGQEFKDLVTRMAQGGAVPRDIARAARSSAFRRWAAKANIDNPAGWLQGVLQSFRDEQTTTEGSQ